MIAKLNQTIPAPLPPMDPAFSPVPTSDASFREAEPIKPERPAARPIEKNNPTEMETYLKDISLLNQMINKKIQFDMEYDNHEIVVRIVDRETEEVLREYPPEELRELRQRLRETAEMLGIIVDTSA